MELTFLGTASAYPTPTRGVSCIVFRNDGTYWMFDCGEGSQIQLMRSPIRPGKISRIFISHLHGDHVFGLPGLLCTISQKSVGTENKATLEIYGPHGLRKFIRTSLSLSRSMLGFKFRVHELEPVDDQYPNHWQEWPVDHKATERLHPCEELGSTIRADQDHVWHVCEDDQHIVRASSLQHWIPSFGYVVQEKPKPGKLDTNKLKERGLKPGSWCSKLKAGESVETPDGQMIHPAEVLGPERPGRKVAILCDTCRSDRLVSLCQSVDCLVHETTLENELEKNCLEKMHSTPEMAGKFAKEVAAKWLIITHFSQRYKSPDQVTSQTDCSVEKLVAQAREAFECENVIAAEDLKTLPVQTVS